MWVYRTFVTIILFGFGSLAVAEPVWTVDLKSFGAPGPPKNIWESRGNTLKIDISSSNEVLVSFVLYGNSGELETRQGSVDKARLVALLLDQRNGTVVQRGEWQVDDGSIPSIARLAEGGFVLLVNDRLQILDGLFLPMRTRTLSFTWSDQTSVKHDYSLNVPVKGSLFGIRYWKPDTITWQIVDSQSLEAVEEWEPQSIFGRDRWVATQLYGNSILGGTEGSPKLKSVGGAWEPFGRNLSLKPWSPHLLTEDHIGAINGKCWFEANATVVLGKPVCYSEPDQPSGLLSSQDGSVIAVGIFRPPMGFAALLDLNGEGRVIVYTQGTHRKLLTVRSRGMALSLDGSLLATLDGEKLSLYKIPRP